MVLVRKAFNQGLVYSTHLNVPWFYLQFETTEWVKELAYPPLYLFGTKSLYQTMLNHCHQDLSKEWMSIELVNCRVTTIIIFWDWLVKPESLHICYHTRDNVQGSFGLAIISLLTRIRRLFNWWTASKISDKFPSQIQICQIEWYVSTLRLW